MIEAQNSQGEKFVLEQGRKATVDSIRRPCASVDEEWRRLSTFCKVILRDSEDGCHPLASKGLATLDTMQLHLNELRMYLENVRDASAFTADDTNTTPADAAEASVEPATDVPGHLT